MKLQCATSFISRLMSLCRAKYMGSPQIRLFRYN